MLSAQGYLLLSDVVRSHMTIERFPRVTGDMLNTTAAGERLDAAGGVVGTARDLHRFADAYLRGDLLAPASRQLVRSAVETAARQPVGSQSQRIASAYHQPYGVLLTAEGDGPGGSNTLLVLDPVTDSLVIALVNQFGSFDEKEFLLGETVPAAIAPPATP